MKQLFLGKGKGPKRITERNTTSMDKYLQEVSKIPLLSTEEEIELAKRIKLGDKEAIIKLTQGNLRFVISVAKQYQNQGVPLADLINEGNIGLIKAAERFDESKGFKFISYAIWRIRQSILQALAVQARIVRLPFNQIDNVNKIYKTTSNLEQVLERNPTEDEVIEHLQMENVPINKEVLKLIHYDYKGISLDNPINPDEPEGSKMIDIINANHENNNIEKKLWDEALKKDIKRILSTLSAQERQVIILYFGLEKEHGATLQEISEKTGLSRERIRQIKEKALRKIKNSSLKYEILKKYLG